MLRIHKREQIVKLAEHKLTEAVNLWSLGDGQELTNGELVRCLTSVLSNQLQSWAKYQIRFERHGNYEDEGGFE